MSWIIATAALFLLVHFLLAVFAPGSYIKLVCWWSAHLWDVHDYKIHMGGNGHPLHFYTYRCWNCGKEFVI